MASVRDGGGQTAAAAQEQQQEVDALLPLQEEAALSTATADADATAAAAAAAAAAVATAARVAAAATVTSPAKADTAHALTGASGISHDAATTTDQAAKPQAPSITTDGNSNIPSTSTASPTPTTTPTSGGDGGGSDSGSMDDAADSSTLTIKSVPAGADDPSSAAPRPVGGLAYERTGLAVVPPATPALPPHYVERSALLWRAVSVLTRHKPMVGMPSPHGDRGGHRLHVLFGGSGSGKTVLASSIVRSAGIRKEFGQGIFWGKAGCGSGGTNSGRFLALVRGLAAQVERDYDHTRADTDDGEKGRSSAATAEEVVVPGNDPCCSPRLACVEEAISQLAKVNGHTRDRRLLVLDDVCDAGVVSELQRAGFVVLVTTTSAGALKLERGMEEDRRVEKLEVRSDMRHKEAVALLKRRRSSSRQREMGGSDMEQRDGAAVDDIAGTIPAGSELLEIAKDWCGLFPLALAVVDANGDAPNKLGWLRQHAEAVKLGRQQQQVLDSAFSSVVGVSITQLDPASRDNFLRLGVLAEGSVAPKDMLSSLWEQSSHETAETIKTLVDRSLLEETLPGSDSYRVHGPILAFANEKLRHDCTAATRDTVVHLQAACLGRVDVLLRFSDGGGGAAWRGCCELGGLEALAALWQSVECLRETDSGGGGDGAGSSPGSAPLLHRMTYERSLKNMGLCTEAACGYWAAAKLLQLQDDPDGAIEMGNESVRIGKDLYHARAEMAHALCTEAALIRVRKGHEDETLHPYERWLQSTRGVLGPDHPAVAAALNSLAGILVEQGKLAEAGVRYREALAVLEDALGDQHPQVAVALIDIAEVITKEKELMKAQEVKRKRQKTFTFSSLNRPTSPPPSPPPAGELPWASGICARALAIFDGDLAGRSSRGKATNLVRLAKILETQGKDKLDEAERLFRTALVNLRSEFEPYPLQVATVIFDLAGVLAQQGKRKQAIKAYRQAIAEGGSCMDPKQEKMATWRNELARVYVSQDKHVEAAAQYLNVIENCEAERTLDRPCVVNMARMELENVIMLVDQDVLLTRMIELTDPDSVSKQKKGGEAVQEATKNASDEATTPWDDGMAVCGDDDKRTEKEDDEEDDEEDEERGDEEEEEDEEIGEEERESLKAAALYLYANDPQYVSDSMMKSSWSC